MKRRLAGLLVLPVLLPACGDAASVDPAPRGEGRGYRVLVYTRTAGFRHPSIEPGVAALRALGRRDRFSVEQTEDPARFTPRRLRRYAALVFLSTTGDVLPRAAQRAALRGYLRDGGGWFGIHAASDLGPLGPEWPWYRKLVGASFRAHPAGTDRAAVRVEVPRAPNMRGLPRRWSRTDEWYAWRERARDIRRRVRVLASLDESSYAPGRGTDAAMGPFDRATGVGRAATDHPIAWCHRYGGGRAVYTGGGHTPESFTADPRFLRHLGRSVAMAAGRAPFSPCRPPRAVRPSARRAAGGP